MGVCSGVTYWEPGCTCHRQEVTENRGSENIWLKIRARPKLTTRIFGHLWPVTSRWGCGVGNCCLGKDDIFALGRVAVGLWRRLLEGRLHFSAPLD